MDRRRGRYSYARDKGEEKGSVLWFRVCMYIIRLSSFFL